MFFMASLAWAAIPRSFCLLFYRQTDNRKMEDLLNKNFDVNRARQALPCSGEEGHVSVPEGSYSSGDRSRKGSLDARILPLATLINASNDFFTTSTCSGRVILFANENVEAEEGTSKKIKKKGCNWLMVSHDEVTVQELRDAWISAEKVDVRDVTFKMEAAILHVQCRKLSDAKKLVHAATESGFRNSGMVIGGKDNRITVAVRSALGLEVPFPMYSSSDSEPLFSDSYLTYLLEKANEKIKMNENWKRLDKLTEEFAKTFPSDKH